MVGRGVRHIPPTTILDLFDIFEGANWIFFFLVGIKTFFLHLSTLISLINVGPMLTDFENSDLHVF